MKVQRKPVPLILAASVTFIAVALLAFFAIASATNSTSPLAAPCSVSGTSLANQPIAVQQQCSDLKQQALHSYQATVEAGPHISNVPLTPNAAFLTEVVTDEVTAIAAFPDLQTNEPIRAKDIFQSDSRHNNPVTSVWRAGVLPGANPDIYLQVIVYAVGPSQVNGNASIFRLLIGTIDPTEPQRAQFTSGWQSPRDVGNLTITGITGQTGVISFASDNGTSGTLDMTTNSWTFSTP